MVAAILNSHKKVRYTIEILTPSEHVVDSEFMFLSRHIAEI